MTLRLRIAQLTCLLAASGFTQYVHARSSSHGADQTSDRDNPWFLGEDAVPFCITAQADTEIPVAELRAMLGQSLGQWREFFEANGIAGTSVGPFPSGQKHRRLSLVYEEVTRGSDHDLDTCGSHAAPLRIKYGITQADEAQHPGELNQVLGAAVREAYDTRLAEGRGTVFLRDFTADPAKLQHILLHELGHVFGMTHDSVYIMDAHVAKTVSTQSQWEIAKHAIIESPEWPFHLVAKSPVVLDFNYGSTCIQRSRIKAGWSANYQIPNHVRRALGLSADSCHQVKISQTWSHEPQRRNLIDVSIEVLDLETGARTVKGSLDWEEIDIRNPPAVVAQWENGAGRLEGRYFGNRSYTPSHGSITIGTETFPVSIRNERGPHWRILVPGSEPGSLEYWTVDADWATLPVKQLPQF